MMGSMMRRAMIGDGSTLSLDFTTGVLDSRLTFTRASTGTFINASGNVATASNNVARFDHDPTTLAPRGLLIEGVATNLCTYSQDFSNVVWQVDNSGATNPVVSSVSQSAPDGAATVNRVTLNKTGGTFSRLRNPLTGTASATYTLSVWMKANTASGGASTQNVGLRIGADPAGFNCVVTTTWTRFRYSYALSGTNADAQVMLWDNIVGNDETADILVWGAQVEAGSGTSYIPTGASTVQRLADNCSVVSPNFAPWFNASAGTLLVSARTATRYVDSAGFDFPAVLTLDSNTHIGPCQWNGVVYGVVRAGGSYRINYATLASPGNNANYKAAIAYADSDYAGVANGGSIQTGSGTTVPSGLNQLALGASRSGVAGNFFGHISQIKFWPTRLPNAQLQSLTT
jgi:hypothetical protein